MTVMGFLLTSGAIYWLVVTVAVVCGHKPDRLTTFCACAVTTLEAVRIAAHHWVAP